MQQRASALYPYPLKSEILFCSPCTIHSINVCDWINPACSVWVSRLWLIIAHVIPLMTDCLIDLSFRDRTQWVNQITHYLPPGRKDVFIFIFLWLFTFILHFSNVGHKLGTFSKNVFFFTHKNRAIKHHREWVLWSDWITAFGPALHQKVRTQPDMCHLSAFCLQTEFFWIIHISFFDRESPLKCFLATWHFKLSVH